MFPGMEVKQKKNTRNNGRPEFFRQEKTAQKKGRAKEMK